MINTKEIWTGLVNIAPMLDCQDLDENERAYTNIILYADNELDFKLKATNFLNGWNFEVLDIEEIGTIKSIKQKLGLNKEMERLLKLVIKEKTPKLTTLHSYIEET